MILITNNMTIRVSSWFMERWFFSITSARKEWKHVSLFTTAHMTPETWFDRVSLGSVGTLKTNEQSVQKSLWAIALPAVAVKFFHVKTHKANSNRGLDVHIHIKGFRIRPFLFEFPWKPWNFIHKKSTSSPSYRTLLPKMATSTFSAATSRLALCENNLHTK